MSESIYVKISARLWSDTASLKPIAAGLSGVAFVYDRGDPLMTARGVRLKRQSPGAYLSTGDTKVTDLTAVRGEVVRHVGLLENDPAIRRLLDDGAIDAVVWVAIFGDQGAVHLDELAIDTTPFGPRLGLVVENYADFDEGGNPRKLLIGRGVRRP